MSAPLLTRRADGAIGHWCPGCRTVHYLNDHFTWDGDEIEPTFYPDKLIVPITGPICHYTIVMGIITYLPRTTHELRGRKMALVPEPSIESTMREIANTMRRLSNDDIRSDLCLRGNPAADRADV
jgi:hypothetical protein